MERRGVWKARRKPGENKVLSPTPRFQFIRAVRGLRAALLLLSSAGASKLRNSDSRPTTQKPEGLYLWAEFIQDFIQADLSVAAVDYCLNASLHCLQKTHFLLLKHTRNLLEPRRACILYFSPFLLSEIRGWTCIHVLGGVKAK